MMATRKGTKQDQSGGQADRSGTALSGKASPKEVKVTERDERGPRRLLLQIKSSIAELSTAVAKIGTDVSSIQKVLGDDTTAADTVQGSLQTTAAKVGEIQKVLGDDTTAADTVQGSLQTTAAKVGEIQKVLGDDTTAADTVQKGVNSVTKVANSVAAEVVQITKSLGIADQTPLDPIPTKSPDDLKVFIQRTITDLERLERTLRTSLEQATVPELRTVLRNQISDVRGNEAFFTTRLNEIPPVGDAFDLFREAIIESRADVGLPAIDKA
jgi:hypothetical protein